MKNLFNAKVLIAWLMVITCFYACKKGQILTVNSFNIHQTNLVADVTGFGAARIDSNLVNAWGLAAVPGGPVWISANGPGLSTIYDNTGKTLRPPVTIPAAASGQTGTPSGVIFNSTADFGGNKFIFVSEDGIITAWKSGNVATIVANESETRAVFKGITMASNGGANFLFVTNFRAGKIEVFDSNFNPVVSGPFHDPEIPVGFAPFNILNIGDKLYVTFAKQKAPDDKDDDSGVGNGFVDIFNADGTFVKRFASRGSLNSPWGIALVPGGFADDEQVILIGNFGDGRINVFGMNGVFKGQLKHDGQPLSIDGLWAIDFLNNNQPGGNAKNPLYFTAGPDDESHGLFGKLQR